MNESLKYLLVLFFTFGAGIVTIIGFNWTMDPYFYRYQQKRIPNVNDAFLYLPTSGSVIYGLYNSESKTILIGTSRTSYGFDTRGISGIYNAGVSAISMDGIISILLEDISSLQNREKRKRYIVELLNKDPKRIEDLSFFRKYFSLVTLKDSFELLFASHRNQFGKKDFFRPDRRRHFEQIDRELLSRYGIIDAVPRFSGIKGKLTRIFELCSHFGVEIDFYHPPYPKKVIQFENVENILKMQNNVWKEYFQAQQLKFPGCKLSYTDFSSLDNDVQEGYEGEWYDILHFTPELGEILFKKLIGDSWEH